MNSVLQSLTTVSIPALQKEGLFYAAGVVRRAAEEIIRLEQALEDAAQTIETECEENEALYTELLQEKQTVEYLETLLGMVLPIEINVSEADMEVLYYPFYDPPVMHKCDLFRVSRPDGSFVQ